jgi:hypothetical protein
MDALTMATAGKTELGRMDDLRSRYIGLKTTQGGDGRGQRLYSLGVFGRPDRITTCDCERSNDPTLLQSLFLYNDGEIHKLINAGGWITDLSRVERYGDVEQQIALLRKRLVQLEKNGDEKRAASTKNELANLETVRGLSVSDRGALVDELFLRTVSRQPTAHERQAALQHVNEAESVSAGMRQMLWVMLNTKEFILNH